MTNVDILVILGTDHHRFDRLVDWVDDLLESNQELSAVVQLGSTRAPRRGVGVAGILPYEELQELTRSAAVIVTHGGPATMWEVRHHGRKPIVVPRDPAFAEHVDNHQILFSRRMARLGLVTVCEDQAAFEEAVRRGLALPDLYTVSAEELNAERVAVSEAIATTGQIIDDLATSRRRRHR